MTDDPHLTLTAVLVDWGQAHGGRSLVGEVPLDEELTLRLLSWDVTGQHVRLRPFLGKRVRVTIVVEEATRQGDDDES